MNTGSFGAPAGGISPALLESIQRRQGGGQQGATAAVTQGAPTFNPATQPPQAPPPSPMQIPQGGNQPFNPVAGQPAPSQAPTMGGMPQSPESEIILKALSSRLSSDSKIKEAQVGLG